MTKRRRKAPMTARRRRAALRGAPSGLVVPSAAIDAARFAPIVNDETKTRAKLMGPRDARDYFRRAARYHWGPEPAQARANMAETLKWAEAMTATAFPEWATFRASARDLKAARARLERQHGTRNLYLDNHARLFGRVEADTRARLLKLSSPCGACVRVSTGNPSIRAEKRSRAFSRTTYGITVWATPSIMTLPPAAHAALASEDRVALSAMRLMPPEWGRLWPEGAAVWLVQTTPRPYNLTSKGETTLEAYYVVRLGNTWTTAEHLSTALDAARYESEKGGA